MRLLLAVVFASFVLLPCASVHADAAADRATSFVAGDSRTTDTPSPATLAILIALCGAALLSAGAALVAAGRNLDRASLNLDTAEARLRQEEEAP